MRKYVVGFAFNLTGSQLCLIRKIKPDWQQGKLNGVGGKIGDGESPRHAMRREFSEETGYQHNAWDYVGVLKGCDYELYIFTAELPVLNLRQNLHSITAEDLEFVDPKRLPDDCIPNLHWIVPLCQTESDEEFTLDGAIR